MPFVLYSIAACAVAQNAPTDIKSWRLQEVVKWAKEKSLRQKQAKALQESGYWRWRSFKSTIKPQMTLNGTLPGFNRSFSPITQPDGSIVSRSVSNNRSNVDINITQEVLATGGQLFINSSLQRFDAFNNDFTQYNTTPFQIGFVQPLFGFNQLIWDMKIRPILYEESDKLYSEDVERIAVQATSLFFDRLIAQINLEIATKNLANNDTIYQIAKGRFNLGTIAENELLQLELSLMNAELELERARLNSETSALALKTFVALDDEQLSLALPDQIPVFAIDERRALEEARNNRQQYASLSRRQLQAQRDISRAKGENGFSADLFASFGLSGTSEEFRESYAGAEDQQSINLGFIIPILDWGRSRSNIRNAEALSALEELRVEEERLNFDQEIVTRVKQFQFQRRQIAITQKSDEVAQKRYEIAKQRYLIGKTLITDLTIADQEKDFARRSYISALRNFWIAYYEIRALTLYDFERNLPIYVSNNSSE